MRISSFFLSLSLFNFFPPRIKRSGTVKVPYHLLQMTRNQEPLNRITTRMFL